jgi:nitrogen fixation-related uncharacterized protein
LSFSIVMACVTAPFLIWAIRSGHFSGFDYARRLALRSRIVEEVPGDEAPECAGKGKDDVPA